ncbi:hypothetical protein [Nocardia aurantia]|uniref:Uncharacterized protein n=1 Tax=Nocardia aurantia TaxID=2585199 RepID=A0A7K0E082_9NOCA|nr:hypothetical protein [Nocardia aurantia]MQY31208.1 hypothetical protein [Nocardia aurantia]
MSSHVREPRFEYLSSNSTDWYAQLRSPRVLLRRYRDWLGATRARRVVARVLAAPLVLVALWLIGGSIANANNGTLSGGSMSAIDGLSWTDVRDTSDVPLSSYLFATDSGSLLHPGTTALALVLGVEFTIFMVVVISAVWMTGYVLSFRWLDWLGKPLTAIGDGLTHQIATPIVLAVSATAGAFLVGWFVLRGYHAKAALQVAAMLAVAVLGATYLAHPLADVLSSDGLLAHGRDVGITIAAGVTGQDSPHPGEIVAGLQGSLSDNFARHPLQVWNFGHVVDDRPGCRAAWSAGVRAGSQTQIANGMSGCGDAYAHAKIDNPSFGQIGTGLVLIVFATILLLFLAYLAIKVFLAALSSVYHGILAVFGFAAGGFVYGPTQVFLIRNLVDLFADAVAMVVYTVFLGVYALLLDALFRSAPGSGMAVIFVGAMVLIAGFALFRRLDLSMVGGQVRVVEQIRAALAGRPAAAGAASPAEMSAASLRYSLSPGHLAGRAMAGFNELGAINANPVTSWAFRRPNPLAFYSKQMQHMNELNYRLLLGEIPPEAAGGWMARLTAGKNAHDGAARHAVEMFGGHNSRAAAAAVTNVLELGGDGADAQGALLAAGFSPRMAEHAVRVHRHMLDEAKTSDVTYEPLGEAAAALRLASRTREYSPDRRGAYTAQAAEAASLFERAATRPLWDDEHDVDRAFVARALHLVDGHADLQEIQRRIPVDQWRSVTDDTRRKVGVEIAQRLKEATDRFHSDPTDANHVAAMEIARSAMRVDRLLTTDQASLNLWTK